MMKIVAGIGLMLMSSLLMAKAAGAGAETIEGLINKLGSPNAKIRLEAMKALQERPDAVPALRGALKSPDVEIARRAAEIIEFIDRRSIRELNALLKNGNVERAIGLAAVWPKDQYEQEVWFAVRGLAQKLVELHRKAGGDAINIQKTIGDDVPPMISAKHITLSTKADLSFPYFIRAGDVDLTQRPKPGEANKNLFHSGSIIVAAGAVRIMTTEPHVIFAGGPVELQVGCSHCIIVSCGDVALDGDFGNSLIIARGAVSSTGMLEANCIISGKSVSRTSKKKNIISENDPNPLGFIRWADAAKDKATPKSR